MPAGGAGKHSTGLPSTASRAWRPAPGASKGLPDRLRRPPARRYRALLALFLWLALPAQQAWSDELRIAVATNFRPAMAVLAAHFENLSQHQIVAIHGSTGKHYAQIVNGAPFDAYLAADAARPGLLEAEQRIVPGSRFTYAIGRLVLWSPDPARIDADGRVLQTGTFNHLAVANPELAPYGAAARQVLQHLGLWEQLATKLVRGENIGQTFQFVVSGNAELGFVARAQLAIPGQSRQGSSWEPPQALYDPIEQQAVLLRDSLAGREFMAFVQGEEARALIRAYGYDVPDVQ